MSRITVPPFHVAVFARAPVPGMAKTRLIPLLGPEGAAQAHRQMVQRAVRTALAAAEGRASLWQAGGDRDGFLARLAYAGGMPCHSQSGDTLGERMASCLRRLGAEHSNVLLVGSDAPSLTVQDLRDAAAVLSEGATMVFTPAEDGGYVLVGIRLSAGDAGWERMFEDVAWGTSSVMAQTRERAAELGWRARREMKEMELRWDVDEPRDFLRAVREGYLCWPPGVVPIADDGDASR